MKRLRTVNRRGRQAEQRATRSQAAQDRAGAAEKKKAIPRSRNNA